MVGVEESDTHEELVVIDRHGRLKLPEDYMEDIGLNRNSRVKMELESGKIVIYKQDGDIQDG
jgi:hypothetical protein